MPRTYRGRYGPEDAGRIERPDAADAVKAFIVKTIIAKLIKETGMNSNAFHNILNIAGMILAFVIGFDWVGLGLPPELVATIMTWAMFGDKILKLVVNITRDGLPGLFKIQPPVADAVATVTTPVVVAGSKQAQEVAKQEAAAATFR